MSIPIRTETAAQADLHLQPFPGTDAALAFSLLHVLHRDGFFQPDFIANHTLGYDEVLPLLAPCTPAWGEQTSGVPADLIERAAHLYGPGPSLLWVGQGLQRQTTGGNVMRACGLLPALTGNIGKPGAGFYYLNITPGIAGLDFEALAGSSLAQGRVPRLSHMGLCRAARRCERLTGPSVLEYQSRGVRPTTATSARGPQARRPVHRSNRLFSPPTPRILPILCCRRRVSLNLTT